MKRTVCFFILNLSEKRSTKRQSFSTTNFMKIRVIFVRNKIENSEKNKDTSIQMKTICEQLFLLSVDKICTLKSETSRFASHRTYFLLSNQSNFRDSC